jgi:hypothetical protein
VINQPIRPSRYQKERKTADREVIQILRISSIRGYIAAIVDLWSFQKNYGKNHHSNPHGNALSSLLAGYTCRENAQKRQQFTDCAAGTLQDGYSLDKIIKLIQFCWQGWMQADMKNRKP